MSRTFGGNPMAGIFFSIVDLLREKKAASITRGLLPWKNGLSAEPGPLQRVSHYEEAKAGKPMFQGPGTYLRPFFQSL